MPSVTASKAQGDTRAKLLTTATMLQHCDVTCHSTEDLFHWGFIFCRISVTSRGGAQLFRSAQSRTELGNSAGNHFSNNGRTSCDEWKGLRRALKRFRRFA
jgi:hypothetical protein